MFLRSWMVPALLVIVSTAIPQIAQAQLTENESLSVVGDAPLEPGPLATDLSPALEPAAIKSAMRKVADWQVARIGNKPSQDWTFATLYVGLLAASATLDDPGYKKIVFTTAEHNSWSLGPRKMHADDQAIGQAYLLLDRMNPDERHLSPMRKQFDELMRVPDDPARPVWWWCDALFMGPPVWAGLSAATHDPRYLDYMNREWQISSNLLWDPAAGLFFRDQGFIAKREANGSKVFWSRGNGWVMGGLVRVIEAIPPGNSHRTFYIQRLKQMAASVSKLQGQDGLWRAGLLDEKAYPLPETSGSAFFVYAIAWGIHHGVLDAKTYMPVVVRGWAGLVAHIYADGRLGCVQPVGNAPGAYTEAASSVFGTGAFLLAGSEVNALAASGVHALGPVPLLASPLSIRSSTAH